jgi:hypothetical protein
MRRAVFTTILLVAPRAALACPVCFGASDSPLAGAINIGVIMMLGVVAVVLGAFATFFVYLNRRARLFAEPAAPERGAYIRGSLSSTTPQEGTAQC